MRERFNALTEELKQRVINITLDKSMDAHQDKFKYNYHGYTPGPAGPNNSDQGYEAGKIANDR